MKIVIYSTMVIDSPPKGYGGLEEIAYLQARYFDERKHEVNLFATQDSYKPKNGNLLSVGKVGVSPVEAWKSFWADEKSRKILMEADIICDHSVAGDEELIIQDRSELKIIKIEDLAKMVTLHKIPDTETEKGEIYDDFKVLTIDDHLKSVWKKVTCIFKHKTNELYNLKTERGYFIKATGEHALYTLNDKGKLEEIAAKNSLGKNIAVLKNPRMEKKYLTKLYPTPENTIIKAGWVRDFVQQNKKLLLGRYKLNNPHIQIESIKTKILRWIRYSYIPVKYGIQLPDKEGMLYNHRNLGQGIHIPIKLTEDLMKFFGIWIGDGCYNSSRGVRISCKDGKQTVDRVAKQLGLRVSKVSFRPDINTEISSTLLVKIMKSLGFNGKAHTKRVPSWIFTLSDKLITAFVEGLIVSDGCIDKNGKYQRIRYCTVNYGLAKDFRLLNQIIGKDISISKCLEKNERINGKEIRQKQPFIYECQIRNNTFSGGIGDIPVIKPLSSLGDKKKKRFRAEKAKISKVKKITKGTEWEYLGNSDVFFVKVKEISLIEDINYVYDIEVEGTNRFICSGVLAHNSWQWYPYASYKELKNLCHVCHAPDPSFATRPPLDKPNMIAVGFNQAKFIYQNTGVQVRAVQNGVDLKQYPFKKEKGDRLLWLSRIYPFKGAHRAIDIANNVKMPIDIVGGSFGDVADYINLIKQKCEESDYAEFHGEVSFKKKVEFYQNAKCVLIPSIERLPMQNDPTKFSSFIEPFGLVTPEANSCGTATIVIPSGGWNESMIHGYNGYFANTNEEFSFYIRHIKDIKPENCRKMAERFDYRIMGLNYRRLFNEIIKGRGW